MTDFAYIKVSRLAAVEIPSSAIKIIVGQRAKVGQHCQNKKHHKENDYKDVEAPLNTWLLVGFENGVFHHFCIFSSINRASLVKFIYQDRTKNISSQILLKSYRKFLAQSLESILLAKYYRWLQIYNVILTYWINKDTLFKELDVFNYISLLLTITFPLNSYKSRLGFSHSIRPLRLQSSSSFSKLGKPGGTDFFYSITFSN